VGLTIGGVLWAPFILADGGTLSAIRPTIWTAPDSVLHLVTDGTWTIPAALRLVQLALALLVVCVLVMRGQPASALAAGVAVRLLVDGGTWPYYTAGLIAGALLFDLTAHRHRLPWAVLVATALLPKSTWIEPDELRALLRLLACSMAIGTAVWFARWTYPADTREQDHVRLRGADAARRVMKLDAVAIGDLFLPFSDEVHHGERVGLIGPNGTGKTHLLSVLAGTGVPDHGTVTFGPRTSVGMFTQINDRPEWQGRQCMDIVRDRVFDDEKSMKALARYGLRAQGRQEFQTLSGGQKARLEILCLELEGHNVLLLDEPTDNLDVDSSEALEQALDSFEGTVVAVSHDRTFLSTFDRFVMITDDGEVYDLPDYDLAMQALAAPDRIAGLRLARNLTA
jgi:ABC-type lipoprotein export system ATPase subunit